MGWIQGEDMDMDMDHDNNHEPRPHPTELSQNRNRSAVVRLGVKNNKHCDSNKISQK